MELEAELEFVLCVPGAAQRGPVEPGAIGLLAIGPIEGPIEPVMVLEALVDLGGLAAGGPHVGLLRLLGGLVAPARAAAHTAAAAHTVAVAAAVGAVVVAVGRATTVALAVTARNTVAVGVVVVAAPFEESSRVIPACKPRMESPRVTHS